MTPRGRGTRLSDQTQNAYTQREVAVTEQFRLDQALAEEWWRDRRPGGFFHSSSAIGTFSDDDSDRAVRVANFVQSRACNPHTLGEVLRLFTATARDDDELAFVGTTHLEDAYYTADGGKAPLAERAMEILHAAGLPDETVAQILRGFQ